MHRLVPGVAVAVALLAGTASAAPSAHSRSVTLSATSPTISKGGTVTLLGVVDTGQPFGPCPPGAFCAPPPEPMVVILARHDRKHRFGRIARVQSEELSGDGSRFAWQLSVSPRRGTTYVAASGGSRSRPLRVRLVR